MLWYSRKGLIFGLCLLLTGALWGSLFSGREKETERMLDYMKKKYGEDFADEQAYAGQTGKAYAMRSVHSQSRPGESVLVRAMGRKEVVFQDNYLAHLLKEEIEKTIGEIAGEIFGECKAFYKIPELVFPSEFPADMEVDAFLRHPLSMVKIYVYVRNSPLDRQEQIDAFLEALSRKGYVIGGAVSYPAGDEMYEMITAEHFTGDIYQGYQSVAEVVFSMKEEGVLSYLRWKESIGTDR